MIDVSTDEQLLLFVLNSTPVIDGEPQDVLLDAAEARTTLQGFGGTGSLQELEAVRSARPLLQAVVRGERAADVLAPLLAGVHRTPHLTPAGVDWSLTTPPDRECVARAVLALADLGERAPGRLRPCANEECRLFLIDRSRANTARWCSMATCGNRLKSRRHYRRTRTR